MLPLSLFRSRVFSACSVAGLLVNIAFYGLIFVISLFFQRVQGLSPLMTGLALAPVMIGLVASNLVSGRLQERLGATRALALGAAIQATACASMLSVGAGTSYAAIVVPLTALGVGVGLVVPTFTVQLLGSVDRRRVGVASGTLNTLRQTGSAVGVALFGSLLAGSARVRSRRPRLVCDRDRVGAGDHRAGAADATTNGEAGAAAATLAVSRLGAAR